MFRQRWLWRTDEAPLLASIVGIHVGSAAVRELLQEITELTCLGYVTTREHAFPDGTSSIAYALTEQGFKRLKQIDQGGQYVAAKKRQAWYEAKWRELCGDEEVRT